MLAHKMREWSGWPDAKLQFGVPKISPYASCDRDSRMFTCNIDALVLNPNRVLKVMTPFRLRQEAVLTGVLLHEAGHARHSRWITTGVAPTHDDGSPVTKQTMALARLLEEARVEGLIAREQAQIGAAGLGWTMRASGAKLMPMTVLSASPEQALMDLLSSYVLRAGKRMAYGQWTNTPQPMWVGDFGTLLHQIMAAHIEQVDPDGLPGDAQAAKVMAMLAQMMVCVDDRGTYMLDTARDVLKILFPETNGNAPGAPMPGGQCADGEADESGEGTGNSAPEDEGSGDDPGAGDSGGDGEDAGASAASTSALAQALAELEGSAQTETLAETADESADAAQDMAEGGLAGGQGAGGNRGRDGYRMPTAEEREIGKGAEKFLRSLIDPTESSVVRLTDTPSSSIDGAAYEAWKAGGKIRAPHFFKRTHHTQVAAPPVRIAVLADISSSMGRLQKPTALLSWALSSAAIDLANFAGRGQQIESCLIHWGSQAYVIQRNGQPVPGIREYRCDEGTRAMAEAFALVEQEIPGFFDASDKPVNRLLVQFTDWELFGDNGVSAGVARMLENGINMLSVVPAGYSPRRSSLPGILAQCKIQRGHSSLLKYDPRNPEQVWDKASEMLALSGSDTAPAPFEGF